MRSIPKTPASGPPPDVKARVLSQNLIALGLTSFFSDISSEMMLAVVPLFLTTSLGFSILGFGLFEAAYQGTNAVFRIWGGSIADDKQNHKQTAATGYSISAATRIALVASSLVAWIPAVPFLLADRVGKGLRTAPRDALISLSTAPSRLAMAFGVHRALDTAGALLGPLIAFAVLSGAPGAFDAVFVISAIAALIGVAVIWTFAEEKPQTAPAPAKAKTLIRAQWRDVLAQRGVRPLAISAGLLSLFTIGDAFIYLVIQRTTDMSARYFPLLFVGTAVVYLTLAVPVGRLADRIGMRPVYLAGNAMLAAVYIVLAFSSLGRTESILVLGLLGAYYAATDGVVPAMASRLVGGELRATGIAIVTVAMAVGRMISAIVFGFAWNQFGLSDTLVAYVVVLSIGLVVAWFLLRPVNMATTESTSTHD